MTTFRLLLNPDERLDVEHAVQLLKKLLPSTTVEGDSFERKRRQLAENITTLSDQGNPIRNPDMLRRVLVRSEAETGPGVDVLITVDDAMKITGSILSGGIRLTTYNQFSLEVVKQIEGYLLSFQIGRLIVASQ